MTDFRHDVIVIGAGPAGLAAAKAVSDHGLSVLMIDEQAEAGGQIWRNANSVLNGGGSLVKSYHRAAEALTILQRDLVVHVAGSTVLDVALSQDPDSAEEPPVRVTWLSTEPGRGVRETATRALVVATGAMERPVLFPGATLPGVMGIGAVQTILKQSGQVPSGQEVVLAGQGPLLLLTLAQILDHGGKVGAVLDFGLRGRSAATSGLLPALMSDPATMAQGVRLLWRVRRSGVSWHQGVTGLRATGGDHGIEQVVFEAGGKTEQVPCAMVAVHDGVIPNTQLTRLLALDHVWKDAQQAFAARVTPEGRSSGHAVWVAGDGAGIAGWQVAQLRGALSGLDVACKLGALDAATFATKADPLRDRIKRRIPARDYIDRLYAPLPVTALVPEAEADSTLVCRCEAVTLVRVTDALCDGAIGPNRVKTFTRCGMGACQGRMCGNALTRIVAETTQTPPQEVGALRIRAPLKPTLISDYLGDAASQGPTS